MTQKNWFQNLSGSKSPLFWRFIEFFRSKKFACKISPYSALKIVFFWKMDLNLFSQDIKKICLLIAFQQSLSSGQKNADFHRYWQILVKNRFRYIAGDLKAFDLFFCFYFPHIDPSKDFCFCKFFAKGLKSEGERLKVKFSSLEMVKTGRDHCCRCRHHLQIFVMMKTTV